MSIQNALAQNAVGVMACSYYLPQSMTVDQLALATSMPEARRSMYTENHGLSLIHMAGEETALDMTENAVLRLFNKTGLDPLGIDTVILYYTLSFLSLEPKTFAGEIKRKLGLAHATAFSVAGQHCASPITALRVARNMLVTGSARNILMLGCDFFAGSLQREITGISLQGEGASCAIIQNNSENNRVLAISTYVDGSLYKGTAATEDELDRFDLVYYLASYRLIRSTLAKASLTMDDIRLIIPHNINKPSWRKILAALRCSESKLFAENIGRCGHVCSADLMINLSDAIEAGRLQKGDYFMLFTVGLGAVWACAILQH
jgi:3-oxoacyl-[acyl-carrier-protein] synthase III